jgi:hypothetical protein
MSKVRLVLAVFALAAAIMWGTADAATPENYSRECQSWAAMIQAGEDDPLMHRIGCDDGPEENGLYARTEGDCAALARHFFREYRNLQLVPYQVIDADPSCVWFGPADDGTYSH